MEKQTENMNINGRALGILSYSLLAAGILLLSPFIVLALVKIAPIGPLRAKIFADLYIIGAAAIFAPFVIIPSCGRWLHNKTDDRSALMDYYRMSLVRYLPVAIIGLIQFAYAGRNYAFHVTAVYALVVTIYAGWLIRRDRATLER